MEDTIIMSEAEQTLDDLNGRFLTFYIGDAVYGIALIHVIEIINIQTITRVPNVPNYIKGIINLRGKVVPVLDVRLKFNLEERAYDDKTCIIVIVVNDMNVGLIVDSVSEVSTIDESNRAVPPEIGVAASNKYLESVAEVDGRIILNIDFQKFFQSDLTGL